MSERIIASFFATNLYLCEFNGKRCMIDCGGAPERIMQKLQEKSFVPEYVLLTHGHYDHIAGLNSIWKAYHPIVAVSEADRAFLTRPEYNLSRGLTGKPFTFSEKCADLHDVAKELGITVIDTPGHTPGSVTIVYGKEAFTGDTLFRDGIGNTAFPLGNEDAERESVQRLLNLPEDTAIYPGHGESSTIAMERPLYR